MPTESDVNQVKVSYGRPDQSSIVQADAPEEQEQRYITTEQLNAALERIKQESISAAQSLVDKADNRLGKRMQELIDRRKQLEAEGQPVSDEAFNRLLEEERLRVIAQDEQSPQVVETDDEIAEINRQAKQILESKGLTLEKEDPEAAYVNLDHGPQVFLATLEIAADMKAKRLGATQEPQSNYDATAAARLPVSGKQTAANPIAHITDPSTLLNMAWSKSKR